MTKTTTRTLRYYAVWGAETRWFHWINVVCIVALIALGAGILYAEELGISEVGEVLLKTVHVWVGYVFAVNLTWRIVWAFIGGPRARWSALLPFGKGYGAAFSAYVQGLLAGRPPTYLGHNPVARLMIGALLVLLVVQAVTGLVLAGISIYYPPLGPWIVDWIAAPGVDPSTIVAYDQAGIDQASWEAMRAFGYPFYITHYWNFYLLLVLIAMHIVAAVLTEIYEGGGIISAMFTGRKVLDRPPVDSGEPGA